MILTNSDKLQTQKNIMKILQTITLKQALEWQDTEEKFCYVCDTFGLYAHMTNTIELIESYMRYLLKFDEISQKI